MSMRDHEARTAEITEVTPFEETTLNSARKTVCANATDPQDAADLMLMLGIHPKQQDDLDYETRYPSLPSGGGTYQHHPITSTTTLIGSFDPHTPHTPPRMLRAPHPVQGKLFKPKETHG